MKKCSECNEDYLEGFESCPDCLVSKILLEIENEEPVDTGCIEDEEPVNTGCFGGIGGIEPCMCQGVCDCE